MSMPALSSSGDLESVVAAVVAEVEYGNVIVNLGVHEDTDDTMLTCVESLITEVQASQRPVRVVLVGENRRTMAKVVSRLTSVELITLARHSPGRL